MPWYLVRTWLYVFFVLLLFRLLTTFRPENLAPIEGFMEILRCVKRIGEVGVRSVINAGENP